MGPIHPVWALAAIHPGWGNRYVFAAFGLNQRSLSNLGCFGTDFKTFLGFSGLL